MLRGDLPGRPPGPEGSAGEGSAGSSRLPDWLERELDAWRVEGPTPAETEALAGFVEGLPAAGVFRIVLERDRRSRGKDLLAPQMLPSIPSAVLRAALAQTGVFRLWFWLASVATVAAGLIFLVLSGVDSAACLATLTPLLTAFGVSHAFRAANTEIWEMEMACPVNPVHMALGRLLTVVAYDIVLGVGASLVVWWGRPPLVLTSLILTWLAPLLITAALTFYLCLHPRLNSPAAAALTAGFWAVQVLMRKAGTALSLFARPGDEGWVAIQLLNLAVACLVLVAAVRSLRPRPGPLGAGLSGMGDNDP